MQRHIASGRVLVNGRSAGRPAQRVGIGDRISIDVPRPRAAEPDLPEALPLRVVFEDDDLLVVDKAAGTVAHPSFRNRSGTVLNAVLGHGARQGQAWRPHFVQRLDKGTSGLLVIAKSAEMHTVLQRPETAFAKDYLALVWGRPSPPRGLIDDPLGRDPLDRRRVMPRGDGAEAGTRYLVVSRTRGLSLVVCRLLTGRTHQIRVHLAARGWPIVGDPTYGRAPMARLDDAVLDRLARALPNQALHAWRLAFRHPRSGAVLTFTVPPPPPLEALIARAGLSIPAATDRRRW